MKDKNGNEIVEENNQSENISQEDLVAKTVAGVLDGLKDQNEQGNQVNTNDTPADIDPFDFSELDQNVNDQNIDPNIDVNNPNISDPNISDPNINNPSINNQQIPLQDPRFDNLSAATETNAKNIETNARITKMNNFIMEFNSEVKGVPELETFRNEAINEAKKSIASGNYIPASDMVAYLDGKASIAKRKNVEVNNNPNIGDNQLNPNTDEKPFDPWAEDVTADDIKEKYKHVQF